MVIQNILTSISDHGLGKSGTPKWVQIEECKKYIIQVIVTNLLQDKKESPKINGRKMSILKNRGVPLHLLHQLNVYPVIALKSSSKFHVFSFSLAL